MALLEGVTTRDSERKTLFSGTLRGRMTWGTRSSSPWSSLGPFTFAPTPAFRGDSISVDDYPLIPCQFLSTAPVVNLANLQVTEVGNLILRRGDIPAYPTDHTPL
ncbi:unnamed protein product [Ectocarpus sp. 12 AP-2014]